MKLTEIIESLHLTCFTEEEIPNRDITACYAGDLLSDVMGTLNENEIWITLQTHKNVAAIASLKDGSAILLVKDLNPDADMLFHAGEEGIPVLGTEENTFVISGKIYQLLNK